MFHDTILIWRDNPSSLILFDFIKWPERDMSDWKGGEILNGVHTC
jgi:hypothetical protein